MTMFHFGNCIALAYLPYFITYKYSGISEYSSVWKCVQAGLGYFVAQLCKMMVLATVFPAHENEGEQFDFLSEFLKSTVDFIDIVGIYLSLVGKGEVKFLAGGLGWATADLISTRLFPLWFGARGIEFDWKYIQMSLDSNINLVHYMALAFFVWAWTRQDSNKPFYPVICGLLLYSTYRTLFFEFISHFLGLKSWSLLAIKFTIEAGCSLVAMNIYDSFQTRENSS